MTSTLKSRLHPATVVSAFLVALFFAALWTAYGDIWLKDRNGLTRQTDFSNFYAAGRLVADGRPADAYDEEIHARVQTEVLGEHARLRLPWAYPPPFLAVARLLALTDYRTAYVVFAGVLLLFYGAVVATIAGRAEAALWGLAALPVLFNVWIGQNGALSAGLLGLGLVLLPKRPIMAGVAFGLLAYKPHFGVLIPLVLLSTGQWRAIIAACGAIVVACVLSLVAFGIEPWSAFIGQLGHVSGGTVTTGGWGVTQKLQSVFGYLAVLGVPRPVALMVHAGMAIVIAIGVVGVWRSAVAHELKAAALAVATLMMSPYQFSYDLLLLAIAAVFLVRSRMGASAAEGGTPWRVELEVWLWLLVANLVILSEPFTKLTTGLVGIMLVGACVARWIALSPDVGYGFGWLRSKFDHVSGSA